MAEFLRGANLFYYMDALKNNIHIIDFGEGVGEGETLMRENKLLCSLPTGN